MCKCRAVQNQSHRILFWSALHWCTSNIMPLMSVKLYCICTRITKQNLNRGLKVFSERHAHNCHWLQWNNFRGGLWWKICAYIRAKVWSVILFWSNKLLWSQLHLRIFFSFVFCLMPIHGLKKQNKKQEHSGSRIVQWCFLMYNFM